MNVGNGVTSTTLTPTVAVSTSTVKVNGVAVASGSASAAISLNVGDNAIPVAVASKKAGGKGDLFEELVSVGNLALVEAFHSFQPDRGATLTTHLFCRVELEIRKYLDPDNSHSENRWKKLTYLGEEDQRTPDTYSSPMEDEEWLQRTLKKLPALQRAVYILLTTTDLTMVEIGKRIGRSKTTVSSLKKKADARIVNIRRVMGRSYARCIPKNKTPPRNENQRRATAKAAHEQALSNRAVGKIPMGKECWYMVDDSVRSIFGPNRSILGLLRLKGLKTARYRHDASMVVHGRRFVRAMEASALLREGYVLESYLSSHSRYKPKILNSEKPHHAREAVA